MARAVVAALNLLRRTMKMKVLAAPVGAAGEMARAVVAALNLSSRTMRSGTAGEVGAELGASLSLAPARGKILQLALLAAAAIVAIVATCGSVGMTCRMIDD